MTSFNQRTLDNFVRLSAHDAEGQVVGDGKNNVAIVKATFEKGRQLEF